ncbi:hypothetical protein HMPREF0083_00320 [Aneurinibacillus aneurinilyticus ATCC 12856]|uniref:Uncharacterized protein n=1 Tax=Aneurinibacillus aneurinilyticus ATCC 12856 TaxID=649747 RepID=U1WSI1_ANEAE|nr:hypothetical protein HMPREF0083_00320 [Aneurinibacillus aneurinilyticus ATCC 12856]
MFLTTDTLAFIITCFLFPAAEEPLARLRAIRMVYQKQKNK